MPLLEHVADIDYLTPYGALARYGNIPFGSLFDRRATRKLVRDVRAWAERVGVLVEDFPSPGVTQEAAKVLISLRVDGSILAFFKSESERLGLPYQTLVSSILHLYASGELIEEKTVDLLKRIKAS